MEVIKMSRNDGLHVGKEEKGMVDIMGIFDRARNGMRVRAEAKDREKKHDAMVNDFAKNVLSTSLVDDKYLDRLKEPLRIVFDNYDKIFSAMEVPLLIADAECNDKEAGVFFGNKNVYHGMCSMQTSEYEKTGLKSFFVRSPQDTKYAYMLVSAVMQYSRNLNMPVDKPNLCVQFRNHRVLSIQDNQDDIKKVLRETAIYILQENIRQQLINIKANRIDAINMKVDAIVNYINQKFRPDGVDSSELPSVQTLPLGEFGYVVEADKSTATDQIKLVKFGINSNVVYVVARVTKDAVKPPNELFGSYL